MNNPRFLGRMTVAMVGLIARAMIVTFGVKGLHHLKAFWGKRHYRRIEPAPENFILTGEDQPELSLLLPAQIMKPLNANIR